jgi:hypothetical protein
LHIRDEEDDPRDSIVRVGAYEEAKVVFHLEGWGATPLFNDHERADVRKVG